MMLQERSISKEYKVLQRERHQQIIAKLNIEGQVFVKELAAYFNVTEDCIRKDLTYLEKEGKLKRVHGGAIGGRVNLHRMNVSERVDLHSEEKKIIASIAVSMLQEGYVIFLDISTISLEIAKMIFEKNIHLTIVTNMIDIMQLYRQESNVRLIFLGGDFNQAHDGFVGTITNSLIRNYRFDLSFIGVVGIDLQHNAISTYETNDGLTKKEVIRSSKQSYMIGESAKLNQDGNYIFASLDDFTGYICEKTLDEESIQIFKKHHIELK